jgi:hypothetical protein
MADTERKSSWEVPPPGPGTLSGFFVAWGFVAGIIGLTLVLMVIGTGPMPLRVVAYDLGAEGKPLSEVNLKKLTLAINQTNPMVLALQGTSKELTNKLGLAKEENILSEGSSAVLSRYPIEKSTGARVAKVRFGKIGVFGLLNMDLRNPADGNAVADLAPFADLARREFGGIPHAICLLGGDASLPPPQGYVEAPAEDKAATGWRILIPKSIEDNLKDCYVPAENKKIKDYSDRFPVVAHFVFRKKDF